MRSRSTCTGNHAKPHRPSVGRNSRISNVIASSNHTTKRSVVKKLCNYNEICCSQPQSVTRGATHDAGIAFAQIHHDTACMRVFNLYVNSMYVCTYVRMYVCVCTGWVRVEGSRVEFCACFRLINDLWSFPARSNRAEGCFYNGDGVRRRYTGARRGFRHMSIRQRTSCAWSPVRAAHTSVYIFYARAYYTLSLYIYHAFEIVGKHSNSYPLCRIRKISPSICIYIYTYFVHVKNMHRDFERYSQCGLAQGWREETIYEIHGAAEK